MNLVKSLFLMLMGLSSFLSAQKKTEKDIWSGTYFVNETNKEDSTTITTDTLVIARIQDADPDQIPAKEKSDLARWSMTSKRDGSQDKIPIKRFLFDIKNNRDAYKEFGWTNLHKKDRMNCIDGGHFFLCQTLPNTTVTFGKDEKYFTKTGVFGIWLHYGVVELEKK